MSTEIVVPDAVITLDTQRAKQALAALDAAIADWLASTLELSLAMADAQATQCWEECDDFQNQKNAGTLELVYRSQGADRPRTVDWLATYCKFQGRDVGSTQARRFGVSGRAYRLLEAGVREAPNGGLTPMPQNERQLRPMTKALQAVYRGKPVPEEDLAANLAECWEEALKRTENNPSKAAAIFPQVARKSGYTPLANRYTPTPKKLREAIEAERFDRDVERVDAEMRRLCRLSTPAGIRKLAARWAELMANEEAHRG